MLRAWLSALAVWLPFASSRRTARFYDLNRRMAEILFEDSGLINYGYVEDGPSGIREAQEALCRRTTASLGGAGRWLDVGCGIGGAAALLATEDPGRTVTGLDVLPRHAAAARARARSIDPGARARFVAGDAGRMPFSGASFDALYSIEAAFHFPDKAAFAAEARRVLVPGGRLAIADIVRRDEAGRLARGALAFASRGVAAAGLETPRGWARRLEAAGFEEVAVEDVTEPTFGGGLSTWLAAFDAHRERLAETYPPLLVRLARLNTAWQIAHRKTGPLRYVLATARRPATPRTRGT